MAFGVVTFRQQQLSFQERWLFYKSRFVSLSLALNFYLLRGFIFILNTFVLDCEETRL